MSKTLILSLISALVSCGPEENSPSNRRLYSISFETYLKVSVDEPIRPHMAEFVEFCRLSSPENWDACYSNLKNLKSVRLKNGPLNDPQSLTIGVCFVANNRSILIRSNVFDSHSLEFKALIWHELGHCLLDFDHIEGTNSHIMNSMLPSLRSLQLNWENFTKDFFNTKVKFSSLHSQYTMPSSYNE